MDRTCAVCVLHVTGTQLDDDATQVYAAAEEDCEEEAAAQTTKSARNDAPKVGTRRTFVEERCGMGVVHVCTGHLCVIVLILLLWSLLLCACDMMLVG